MYDAGRDGDGSEGCTLVENGVADGSDAVGYDGFSTIEREVGANRVADINGAIEVIRSQ